MQVQSNLRIVLIFIRSALTGVLIAFSSGPTLAAGSVSDLIPVLQDNLAGELTDTLVDFYNQRAKAGEDPLVNEDEAYTPNLDPRGRPSLPSSCLAVARQGSSTNRQNSPPANRSNAGAGNPASTKIDSDSGSKPSPKIDSELEALLEKLEQDHTLRAEAAQNKHDSLLSDAERTLKLEEDKAAQYLARDTENAKGNAERIGNLAQAYSQTLLRIESAYLEELSAAETQLNREIEESQQRLDQESEVAKANSEANTNSEIAADKKLNQSGLDKGTKVDSDKVGNADDNTGSKVAIQGKQDGNRRAAPTTQQTGSESEADAEKKQGCACLESAYSKLEKRQYSLEKLLKIGQHTKKVLDYAISFGDDVAGMHAVAGLAWQSERKGILQSKKSFDNTYNNKYKELTDKLYNVLQEIDFCERKMGVENWYSNSGFIYFEFMKARYASYE